MEINVGDIVIVKWAEGNGVYPEQRRCTILDYQKHNDKEYVSGLLQKDHNDQQFIIHFIDESGFNQYRRIYKRHVVEIIESFYSPINTSSEDLTYLIKFMQDKEVIWKNVCM